MFIEIDGWRSSLRFSSCHFIPEYPGAPRVHGYTYTINVRIYGRPNDQGLILDFGLIKSKLNDIIEKFDHKIIMPERSVVRKEGMNINFNIRDKSYSFPESEVCLVDLSVPSAEELSRYILNQLMDEFRLPDNVTKIELGLDESWGHGAWSSFETGKTE